ncbi:OsmC family protein [Arthrobacter mobilis]|uniref:OsmC family protein n=1 Tax=Arthrobacter mobilis TaxID=2724944 RepID=A0A7X6HCV9_9MICC|nr:OsmC family protein [Arthrobacter mobilis]NKX54799.1 OsmC family protein [Arthrobacter mobilis]
MTETAVRDLAEDRAARLDEAGAFWSGRIAENTANARLTFKASGDGEGAVATRITAGKHEFTVDEPAGLAGDDAAASPVEYALGALISCQVVVYRLYAHQLGIKFDEINIAAEGDLDVSGLFGAGDGVRPGFEAVRLKVEITGPETQERYEELRRTVDAHCPVLDLFANPTPVSIQVTKN